MKTASPLKKYRKEIDKIDNNIAKLVLKRLKIVNKIGDFKKKQKMKIINKNREKEILKRLQKKAKSRKEKAYLKNISKEIILNSRKVQR